MTSLVFKIFNDFLEASLKSIGVSFIRTHFLKMKTKKCKVSTMNGAEKWRLDNCCV